MSALPSTFDEISDPSYGKLFPRWLLRGCDSALMLFAAGFYGRNDCYWVAQAELMAECVDMDTEKLRAMAMLYPPTWGFFHGDAFAYAASAVESGWEYLPDALTWNDEPVDEELAATVRPAAVKQQRKQRAALGAGEQLAFALEPELELGRQQVG